MKLTSIECANIVNWIAFHKYNVALNKTQMQKILYLIYGIYLSTTQDKLFVDDTPKAWPFGPVFPRVNKYYTPGVIPSKESLSLSKIEDNTVAFDIIKYVVEKFYKFSAIRLSEWSHSENGPWYKTVYGEGKSSSNSEVKWNVEISDELIKNYFPKYESKQQ